MWEPIREVYQSRELLFALAYRDIRIRYKQTVIGAGWAIVMPLLMMIVFTQAFQKTDRLELGDIPYSVYVLCALLPWQFFASSVKGAVESLTKNNRLVTKIYFPREVFPFSQILVAAVDLAVASLLLIGLMAWHGITPKATIFFLPVVLGVQVLFMIGLGLLLSMANLFYRDVKFIFEFILLLWMFVSGVMFPMKDHGILSTVLNLNPMTPIIDAYRQVLLFGQLPDMMGFCYAGVLSLLLCAVAIRWFHEAEFLFAEII